jgi:hypothetical protein
MLAFLAFLIPFTLYISLPSRMWNFDGVACAVALEWGNPVYWFHGNHLWYGFLGTLFWKFLLLPLGVIRALPALQLFTSLLSACGLTGLYLLLNRIIERPLALLLTWLAGICAVFWVWSIEAQVYPLAFLPLAFAAWFLFQPAAKRKWRLIGLLQGLTALGHIVHVLWSIPALYWLIKESGPRERRSNVIAYFSCLLPAIIFPYLLVLLFLIWPHHPQQAWLERWFLGSAALDAAGRFAWHGGEGWEGPFIWLWTSLRFFWGSLWPYGNYRPNWFDWTLTTISMGGTGFLFLRSFRSRQEMIWRFSWLWIAAYGLFFWAWEPQTECYRLTDSIPFFILLAVGLKNVKGGILKYTLVLVILIVTLSLNLRTRIIHMHDAGENPIYTEVMELVRRTPDDSLYITSGGTRWIYLLYFSGRMAWNYRLLERNPGRLQSALDRRFHETPVFLESDTLNDPRMIPLISRYRYKTLQNIPWVQLQ